MASTGSSGENSTGSSLSKNNSFPSQGRRQSLYSARTNQSPYPYPSTSSNDSPSSSCQITVLPEMVALSPLIGNHPNGHFAIAGSSSQSGLHAKEAGPLPSKVGEIGYVASAEPTLPPHSIVRNQQPSTQTTHDDDLQTSLQSLRSMRTASSWSPAPTGSSPYSDHDRGGPSKPREKTTPMKMLLRPFLLVFLGLVVLIITFVGFLQVQERINNSNNKKNHFNSNSDILPDLEGHNGTYSSNSTDASSAGSSSNGNASFVYLGTIFIVALLIEFWVFVGTLRRLYHRLGLWIDQEYPLLLPDLSDPEASIPPIPVLPLWARILRIKPQAVRPPLLPPYMAVLNMIRIGGRSEINLEGTGDVEDGEVIRTLAIGQGQAAPAFNGEEFKKSTIILSGPPKRNSIASVAPSIQSTGALLRKLSRSLTGRFSARNSSASLDTEAHSSSQNRS